MSATLEKAVKGAAIVQAQQGYRSAIEEALKTWPFARSFVKISPGLAATVEAPGIAPLRPWVSSPRRVGASRPVVTEDLLVDDLVQERDLPEARDRSGVRLELSFLPLLSPVARRAGLDGLPRFDL